MGGQPQRRRTAERDEARTFLRHCGGGERAGLRGRRAAVSKELENKVGELHGARSSRRHEKAVARAKMEAEGRVKH